MIERNRGIGYHYFVSNVTRSLTNVEFQRIQKLENFPIQARIDQRGLFSHCQSLFNTDATKHKYTLTKST